MRKICLLISIVFTFSSLFSQDAHYCGAELSPEQRDWLRTFQADPSAFSDIARSADYHIPIQAHIIGNDNGTATSYYRLQNLYTAICELNERYEPTGFFFFLEGDINYVDNSEYYEHDFFNGALMMNEYNVNNRLNMYFVADPAGNCGYYSPFGDAVAIAKTCGDPGETTITHELGHFFSLPHTFDGWENGDTPPVFQREKVDGSNCNSAGDGFCDTPPDYAYYRWNCPSTGPFTDPDGVEFVPDGTFYMSYSNDACTDKFGDDQRQAMRSYLNFFRPNLISDPFTPAVLAVPSQIEPADEALNTDPNYTVLKWTAVEGAESYHVSIAYNTSFTAIVKDAVVTDTFFIADGLITNRSFRWKVKALSKGNTCADYSPSMKFTTGDFIFSGIEDAVDFADNITLYPNPVTSGNGVNLNINALSSFEANIQLINIKGQVLNTMQQNFTPGNQTVSFDIGSLADGFYMLRMQAEGQSIQRKFIVSR